MNKTTKSDIQAGGTTLFSAQDSSSPKAANAQMTMPAASLLFQAPTCRVSPKHLRNPAPSSVAPTQRPKTQNPAPSRTLPPLPSAAPANAGEKRKSPKPPVVPTMPPNASARTALLRRPRPRKRTPRTSTGKTPPAADVVDAAPTATKTPTPKPHRLPPWKAQPGSKPNVSAARLDAKKGASAPRLPRPSSWRDAKTSSERWWCANAMG